MTRRSSSERWRPVVFPFGARYLVSDAGRIRSKEGHLMALSRADHGLVVRLSLQGESRTFRVHRLVAYAFIEGMTREDRVRFLDGDPFNPALSNLMREPRFGKVPLPTNSDRGRCRGENHPTAKLTDDQVAELRQRFLSGESRVKLAFEFGISRGHVQRIGRGTSRPG